MPKMKTHKGASGRFEVTKKGKLKRRRQGHNHMLEKKTPQQKRRLPVVDHQHIEIAIVIVVSN